MYSTYQRKIVGIWYANRRKIRDFNIFMPCAAFSNLFASNYGRKEKKDAFIINAGLRIV